MKRWLLLVLAVVVILVVVIGFKAHVVMKMFAGFAKQGEPKFAVTTAKAASEDWQPELSAVGALRAARGADLSTEVSGLVRSVEFASGDDIKAGKVLMRLVDDSDIASLKALQATADLAAITLKRDKAQLEAEAIAQAQVDSDSGNLKSAQANVAQAAALVAKKTLRAPFDGRLGISTTQPGQYINPGDVIVTLQQLDPIYVDFTLPQQSLSMLSVGQTVSARSDSLPGKDFQGTISAINPVIDTATRNVKVQATIRNPEKRLLPGMFATVKIASGGKQRYITLPQTAVTYNPYGETVYVIVPRGQENAPDPNKPEEIKRSEALGKIDAEQKAKDQEAAGKKPQQQQQKPPQQDGPPPLVARQLFVEVGPTRGDQVAVVKGLKEGDEVVTSGQLKLKNGAAVTVNNAVLPANNPAPKPENE